MEEVAIGALVGTDVRSVSVTGSVGAAVGKAVAGFVGLAVEEGIEKLSWSCGIEKLSPAGKELLYPKSWRKALQREEGQKTELVLVKSPDSFGCFEPRCVEALVDTYA